MKEQLKMLQLTKVETILLSANQQEYVHCSAGGFSLINEVLI
jgi:hypothetical protein